MKDEQQSNKVGQHFVVGTLFSWHNLQETDLSTGHNLREGVVDIFFFFPSETCGERVDYKTRQHRRR